MSGRLIYVAGYKCVFLNARSIVNKKMNKPIKGPT